MSSVLLSERDSTVLCSPVAIRYCSIRKENIGCAHVHCILPQYLHICAPFMMSLNSLVVTGPPIRSRLAMQ